MGTTPYTFACPMCKKGAGRRKPHARNTDAGQLSREGTINQYRTTGRRKGPSPLIGGCSFRSSNYLHEYRCLVCGHVGWSRHVDVERKWLKEHGS